MAMCGSSIPGAADPALCRMAETLATASKQRLVQRLRDTRRNSSNMMKGDRRYEAGELRSYQVLTWNWMKCSLVSLDGAFQAKRRKKGEMLKEA
eukprot:s2641_g3.t1